MRRVSTDSLLVATYYNGGEETRQREGVLDQVEPNGQAVDDQREVNNSQTNDSRSKLHRSLCKGDAYQLEGRSKSVEEGYLGVGESNWRKS